MLGFIVIRAGQQGVDLPAPGSEPDRIGMLRVGKPLDPGFDLLSPVEMVLAPEGPVFGSPLAAFPSLVGEGSDSEPLVRAAADGVVVTASSKPGSAGVVLLHDRPDGVVETIYEGLSAIRVGVGGSVRRGDPLGTVSDRKVLRFRVRGAPLLGLEMAVGETGTLLDTWIAPKDRLAAPPRGEAIEPGALMLQEAPSVDLPK